MKRSLIVPILVLLSLQAFAQEGSDKHTADKAEFIIKLVDNVRWTSGGGPADTDTVVIAVIGESSLTPILKELSAKESDEGRCFEIKEVTLADDLADCHILFLAVDSFAKLAKILKKVDSSKALTVGDARNFARYGVMINLSKEDNSPKLKLEVNTLVLKSAGIELDDKLLKKAIKI